MSGKSRTMQVERHACPICGHSTAARDNPSFPFCSIHCKSVDLYNWLSGGYQVPGLDLEDDEDEEEGQGDVILFD